MTSRHQLIGAQVSYYTGKVRAYLRYKGVPFDEIPATREISGRIAQRAIYPFNVWRWQRPHDHYDALAPGDRACADLLLARVGGLVAIRTPIPCRVQRKDNQLFVA
jgi:hypothetical protein